MRGYEDCTGCNICVLPCPVWKETNDMSLTLAGRAKALQGGAKAEDLLKSLESCVLCGACEPVCPVEIDTVGMTLDLRKDLMAQGKSPLFEKARSLAEAQGGEGIAAAIESGLPVDAGRLERYLAPLRGKSTVVEPLGLLHRHLRAWLPLARVIGLGEFLLESFGLRKALRAGDLYIVETRGYHADFRRLVVYYDALRVESGCMMNLDLQRAAVPTGAMALQLKLGAESVNVARQTQWILEGREVKRVIVESPQDKAAFDGMGLQVLSLSELKP